MSWKSTTELLGTSPIELAAKKNAQVIAERVALLKRQRQAKPYIDSVENELIQAASADLSELAASRARELQKALNNERETYLRDRERNGEAIERRARATERQLEAMATDELQAFARQTAQAVNGGNVIDPDTVDALSVSLKRAGLEELHAAIREAAKEARVSEPWIHSPRGKELDAERAAAQRAATMPGTIPVKIDGKYGAASFAALVDDAIEGGTE